jgi:hypothetical protein
MTAAVDTYTTYQAGLDSVYTNAAAISTSDTVDLATASRAIYCGSVGDITATMLGGGDVLFKAVPTGTLLPIRVTRVKATGTGASQLVALW